MQVYRIAEMNTAIDAIYEKTYEYMADFVTDATDYELYIKTTDEMIEEELRMANAIHGPGQSMYICEAIAILRIICGYIIGKGGFFLHCSCLRYKGEAIIFTAKSGTGKSTHTALWRKHFGDEVEMINDDKPLVRLKNGRFYVYGTPWNGKHNIGSNIAAPIKAVVFLEQAKENSAFPLSPIEGLTLLMQQTVMPIEKPDMSVLLDLLGAFVENIPIYRLRCNISDKAVTEIYGKIYSDSQNDSNSEHKGN